ncbi:MAG: fused MFS/spermidine synthase, partial [Gemmatimonadota bacterium]
YYIAIAAGGALGGVFNALIAPSLLDSYFEYPLAMLLAVWLNLGEGRAPFDVKRDLVPPAILVGFLGLMLWTPLPDGAPRAIALVIVPVLIAYMLSQRVLRFTLALGAILFSGGFDLVLHDRVLHAERNFYGLLRVTTDEEDRFRQLLHGNTLHGAIARSGATAGQPLTYYWTGSPVAEVIRHEQNGQHSLAVGVVGLGVGALAWYARPDEQWTFYEINPAVVELARDTTLFTFLAESGARTLDVVTGDARLMLRDAPDSAYHVLVLDAFTSDAIPLHILTVEAVGLYLDKLKPGGLLVFHVSNRYLDLPPVIAAVGREHGLHAYLRIQQIAPELQAEERYVSSDWLVLARSPADFPLAARRGWLEVHAPGVRAWTDDYSNIWTAFAR